MKSLPRHLHMQHDFPSDLLAENTIKPSKQKGKFLFFIHILLIHIRLQTKPMDIKSVNVYVMDIVTKQTPQHTYLVTQIH
jgi:hypothetical protein